MAASDGARSVSGQQLPFDPEPEPGDTVIELRHGIPYIYTQPEEEPLAFSSHVPGTPYRFRHGWIPIVPGIKPWHGRRGNELLSEQAKANLPAQRPSVRIEKIAPGQSVLRSEEPGNFGDIYVRWRAAKQRAKYAKGPIAAQSADRSMKKYEEQLRAMGAERTKLGWRMPPSGEQKPPEARKYPWMFTGTVGKTPHEELLRMRTEARREYPAGHPERLKAERAVRQSRKLQAEKTGTPGAKTMKSFDLISGDWGRGGAEVKTRVRFDKREFGGYEVVRADNGRSLGWVTKRGEREEYPGMWEAHITSQAFRGTGPDDLGDPLDSVPESYSYRGAALTELSRTREEAAGVIHDHLVRSQAPAVGFGEHYGVKKYPTLERVQADRAAEFKAKVEKGFAPYPERDAVIEAAKAYAGRVIDSETSPGSYWELVYEKARDKLWYDMDFPGAPERPRSIELEALYREHPELPWDSFEQNAADMGLEVDSPEWFAEVLAQARAAIEEGSPSHEPKVLEGDKAWDTRNGELTTTVGRAHIADIFANDGDTFDDLNDSLRGGDRIDQQGEDAQKFIEMIRDSRPFTDSVLVHRGMTDPDEVFGPVGSKTGTVWQDLGVVATTPDLKSARLYGAGEADNAATIHITLPPGTIALKNELKISNSSRKVKRQNWREYTLPPGTRFRIVNDEMVNGVRTLELVVIPNG